MHTLTNIFPYLPEPFFPPKNDLVVDSGTANRLCVSNKGTARIQFIDANTGEEDSLNVRILVMDTFEHNHLRWQGCMAGNIDTANAAVSVG